MAHNTPITLTLLAKDWETVTGIISQTAGSELLDILFKLMTAYKTSVPETQTIALAGYDANYTSALQSIRKNGRRTLMILSYDNN